MRLGHILAAVVTATILTTATAGAADGILITQKMTSGGGAVTTTQVQIDNMHMRAEGSGPNGRKQTMIFDGTAQVMRMIDDEAKTYSEMTKADIEGLSGQMSGAMTQMQEQMKNLPPEARARMEEMMKGRGMAMPGSGAAPIAYKKVGTDKVGKWTCDKYEGRRGAEGVGGLHHCARRARVHRGRLRSDQADGRILLEAGAARRQECSASLERRQRLRRRARPHDHVQNGAQDMVSELADVSRRNFPRQRSRCRPATRSAT
jgi:hypothetical protein